VELEVSLTYVIAESGKSWWWATKESGADGVSTNCACRQSSPRDRAVKSSFIVIMAAGAVAVLRLSSVALAAIVDGCGATLARLLQTRPFGSIGDRKVLRKKGLGRVQQQQAVRSVLGRVCYGAFMGSKGCRCTPAGALCTGCAKVGMSVEVVGAFGVDTRHLGSELCCYEWWNHATLMSV